MPLSNVGFFSRVVCMLESAGSYDDARGTFIVAVITGTNSTEHRFRSRVNIGSNLHDLTGTNATNRSTSNS